MPNNIIAGDVIFLKTTKNIHDEFKIPIELKKDSFYVVKEILYGHITSLPFKIRLYEYNKYYDYNIFEKSTQRTRKLKLDKILNTHLT